jgi:hypothetical protein
MAMPEVVRKTVFSRQALASPDIPSNVTEQNDFRTVAALLSLRGSPGPDGTRGNSDPLPQQRARPR